ncbi:MAG TPA: hypothetical protein GX399_16605 [Xanthomonadaceae bacterium]|nr:hypothetical protein [Xanthomonadaceae bacterium]
MSTTAVIVEHLISGLQAAVWLALLLLASLGYDWIKFDQLKDITAQLTFLMLTVVYPLGIFIDDVADFLFEYWSKRIRSKRFELEGIHLNERDVTAFQVLQDTKDDFLRSYFSYIRMRIRISRSASLNFGVCTLATIVFTVVRIPYTLKVLLVEFIVGAAFTSLAVWAWYRVSDIFAKQISRAFKAQNEHQE